MTHILLVRHGLHDWVGHGIAGRLPEVALNAQGRRQVEVLTQALQDARPDAIYSSPQERAQQTAGPLAHACGMPVQGAREFDEIDFGDWQGRSFADLQRDDAQRWKQWVEHRASAAAPGGETFLAVRDRAMRGMERLRASHPHGTVLVASHGDVIKALVATYLRMSLDDLETFDVACASVTIVAVTEGWAQVKQVGGTVGGRVSGTQA